MDFLCLNYMGGKKAYLAFKTGGSWKTRFGRKAARIVQKHSSKGSSVNFILSCHVHQRGNPTQTEALRVFMDTLGMGRKQLKILKTQNFMSILICDCARVAWKTILWEQHVCVADFHDYCIVI